MGLSFIPWVICEHGESWRGWCRLGKTPDSANRALWQSYQQKHLGASRRNGLRNDNFAYQYLRFINRSLTCRKILRYGDSGFTSHPKEGVLQIFIALKNPSPWLGLNPRPFGPVASSLTNTTPRWQKVNRLLQIGSSDQSQMSTVKYSYIYEHTYYYFHISLALMIIYCSQKSTAK
jgi:hypothetical protein